jgi:hypothetical protein
MPRGVWILVASEEDVSHKVKEEMSELEVVNTIVSVIGGGVFKLAERGLARNCVYNGTKWRLTAVQNVGNRSLLRPSVTHKKVNPKTIKLNPRMEDY